MADPYAKVKYALYNSHSIQGETDDEDDANVRSIIKYTSRKNRGYGDVKVPLHTTTRLKNLDGHDSVSQPFITLHQVSREGNSGRVKSFLDNLSPEACKLKINQLDHAKRAPLHYAARYNHLCVTQVLIDKGADVNIVGEDGLTPLHFAARYGYSKLSKYTDKSCLENSCSACQTVICKLIENGALVNSQDNYGMTPLHYAAMRGNAIATKELLKSNKINTEISDKQEMTPLHCAANYNNLEVVELLLSAKANPSAFDENLSTPLHLAAATGNKEIVLLLLEAVEKNSVEELFEFIEEKNISNNTALHLAVTKGHLEVVQLLLNKGANAKVPCDNFSQPLHLAAISGNVQIVKCLIQHEADINCINSFTETPLHKAAAYNAIEVVDFLLEKGASIESRDSAHFTPLLVAVSEGHVNIVEKLLKAGADIDVVDNMDRNVAFWAAQENHPPVLMTLLEYGNANALVNRCDHYDNSPLHVAALKGFASIAEILLNNGAEIEKKNEHEQTPLHLAAKNGHVKAALVLINHSKTVVNSEDENSNTPLHLACLCGHYKIISVLLNAGANINARNCYLWTSLDCAASRGWKLCCQILLKAGCPVDPLDKTKTTPLHLAAREGHKGIVKLLLKYGANIAQCDMNGKNCLDLAIDKGQEEVALEILSSDKWQAVLRNESEKNKFGIHQTPLRSLIQIMPEVAERVFDKCVVRNEFPDDHPQLKITYNYEFLDDMFACYKPHLYDDLDRNDSTSSGTSIFTGSNIYSEDGNVKKKVKPYTDDKEILQFNHPLMLMVTYKRENLLSHPLCESLLMHKWRNYGRYVYYGNLFLFIFFLTFLTSYVITAVPPCPEKYVLDVGSKCCNHTCQPYIGNCDMVEQQEFPFVCQRFIYMFAVIHLLKEVYQMYQNGLKYLNLENILEWSCYLCALIFVTDFSGCSSETGIRQVWQWELGCIAVFSAWMVLLMFISKFPFLGIYVVMFLQILCTFVNFSFVFFLFVVAFALAFFTVLQNQNPFETPWESIIKTGVMMIGEIEFDAIFNDPENKVFFEGPTYLLFVLFLLIMTIIIMNLLIGLAVDDIKGVQEKAELKRLAMKVELVMTVERILPTVVLRKCISRFNSIRPNVSYSFFARLFQIHHTLPTRITKSSLETVEDKQSKLYRQLSHVEESIRQLQREVKNMQLAMELKEHQG